MAREGELLWVKGSPRVDREDSWRRRRTLDARRLVAALDAVEGIPTAMLERGLIRSLVRHRVDQLVRENPELQEILEPSFGDSRP